jgi:hypothetical protein
VAQTFDHNEDHDDARDEDPLEADQDPGEADDVEETLPCPFCRRPVHEDADVCPHCGNFVGGTDAPPWRRVPVIVWVGVVLALLCVLVWVLR